MTLPYATLPYAYFTVQATLPYAYFTVRLLYRTLHYRMLLCRTATLPYGYFTVRLLYRTIFFLTLLPIVNILNDISLPIAIHTATD